MTAAITVQVPAYATRRRRVTAGLVHGLSLRAARRSPDVPTPDDDSFYSQDVGRGGVSNGELLEARSVELPGPRWLEADARQIRFVSSDDCQPFTAVSTVLCPQWSGDGPQPVLSSQFPINSLAVEGDPSHLIRTGSMPDLWFLRHAIEQGWAIVATDFRGPRHGYGITGLSGRIVLDGITAALASGVGRLGGDSPVVLWGYSAGAYASLQAAELAPMHAPGIGVRAVVAGGVTADLRDSIDRIDGGLWAGLGIALVAGLARNHPEFDLESCLSDEGAAVLADAGRMRKEQLGAAFPYMRWRDLLSVDHLSEVPGYLQTLKAIDLGRGSPTADVHLYHPARDQLAPIHGARRLADRYRSAGANVSWRTIRLGGHMIGSVLGQLGAIRRIERYADRPLAAGPARR